VARSAISGVCFSVCPLCYGSYFAAAPTVVVNCLPRLELLAQSEFV